MSAHGVFPYRPRGSLQFLREVRTELRKVDWPTRSEVVTYSVVVLATVTALTMFVALLARFREGALRGPRLDVREGLGLHRSG